MMPEEKTQLLALFECDTTWCRDVEARNANGDPVTYNADDAVAWDITGALCRLFGWQRACVLFGQFERHFIGKPISVRWPMTNESIDAMRALQDFNDRDDTTFELLHDRLEAMPVWKSKHRANGAALET